MSRLEQSKNEDSVNQSPAQVCDMAIPIPYFPVDQYECVALFTPGKLCQVMFNDLGLNTAGC